MRNPFAVLLAVLSILSLSACQTTGPGKVTAAESPLGFDPVGFASPEMNFINSSGSGQSSAYAALLVTEPGRALPRAMFRLADAEEFSSRLNGAGLEFKSIELKALLKAGHFLIWPLENTYFDGRKLEQVSAGTTTLRNGELTGYELFTVNGSQCLGMHRDIANIALVGFSKAVLQGYYCLPGGETFTEDKIDAILNAVTVKRAG